MHFKNKHLSLESPQVMGILNVTPDSFSDGGKFNSLESSIDQAHKMISDGASILDIGGESTRPGAKAVSLQEELDRVVPVMEALATRFDVVLSIDTSKAKVMTEAVAAGADLINDVCALREEGALEAASSTNAAVCLMHMQGQPRSMQQSPRYEDVIQDILRFLEERVSQCTDAGIEKSRIIVDPGFGFGKTLDHNCEILAQLDAFGALDLPVLAGISRKSMFGALLGLEVHERLVPSVVSGVIAAQKGAKIIRVHDVKETVDALTLLKASQKG